MYRYSYSYSPTKASSPWTTAGESISLNTAKDTYGLTEEEIRDAKLDFRRSSYFGNPVVRFITADIQALSARLKEEKEVAKFGSREAYEAHKAAEAKKAAEEAEAKRKKEADEAVERRKKEELDRQKEELDRKKEAYITKYLLVLDMVRNTTGIPASIDGEKLNKTNAKKVWGVRDVDMGSLQGVKDGRSVMYNVSDLIAAAEKRVTSSYNPNFAPLVGKVGDGENKRVYVRYLQDKLDRVMTESGMKGTVHAMLAGRLSDNVTKAEAEAVAANRKVAETQMLLSSFHSTFNDVQVQSESEVHARPQGDMSMERAAKVSKVEYQASAPTV